jgi:hypothetical protein
LWLAALVVATAGSCTGSQTQNAATQTHLSTPGVHSLDAGSPEIAAAAGQTVYVPAYSAVATADNSRLYQLAITLAVRNSDVRNPIIVKSVNYHDRAGRLVRRFLETPLRIDPLAAIEFFVRESDTSVDTAASFLVEWVAEATVSDPVVEAIMVGTTGNQGISFVCPGRVVADRGK